MKEYVQLNVDKKTRANNIRNEHEAAGKESFLTELHKLDERLDLTVMKEMELLIHAENYEAFIERMLDYYDNASKYQLLLK